VHEAKPGIRETDTAQVRREGHVEAELRHILPAKQAYESRPTKAQSLQSESIRHRIGSRGHVRLEELGDRIQATRPGHRLGCPDVQRRVDDRRVRDELIVAQ
jgi:hypothetical protein